MPSLLRTLSSMSLGGKDVDPAVAAKRKRYGCAILLLILGGVAAAIYLSFQQSNAAAISTTAPVPTNDEPDSVESDGNPTNAPSAGVLLDIPLDEELPPTNDLPPPANETDDSIEPYDPPSEEDCLAISMNETIAGQEGLEQTTYTLKFDATLRGGGTIEEESIQKLLEAIQEKIVPRLVGCEEAKTSRSEAFAYWRYVILNAQVTGHEEPSLCREGREVFLNCHGVDVELTLFLQGPVSHAQISQLISEREQAEINLVSQLGLKSPFFNVRMLAAEVPESPSPSMAPSIEDSSVLEATRPPAQTIHPTPEPSIAPSSAPSVVPSSEPSKVPTPAPSETISRLSPTPSPVSVPTSRPTTRAPTAAPPTTKFPTKAPTPAPTPPPSKATLGPTPQPTKAPTPQPTTGPTRPPTKAPTPGPTTRGPTPQPTKGPTKAPTPPPTKGPTKAPTPQPTKGPTKAPTPQPTKGPTRPPTNAPTPRPTTKAPTPQPTKGPTKAPTPQPTKAPTPPPTQGPTPPPTKAPTPPPTTSPPTKAPTPSPTAVQTSWQFVANRAGSPATISSAEFKSLVQASPHGILRRLCINCASTHRNIYYKRLTGLPGDSEYNGQVPQNFLDVFLNAWHDSPRNNFNVDFELYSSYGDAIAGRNRWQYCDFNGEYGVGFPKNCGPSGSVAMQWNSGTSDSQADYTFYVETLAA